VLRAVLTSTRRRRDHLPRSVGTTQGVRVCVPMTRFRSLGIGLACLRDGLRCVDGRRDCDEGRGRESDLGVGGRDWGAPVGGFRCGWRGGDGSECGGTAGCSASGLVHLSERVHRRRIDRWTHVGGAVGWNELGGPEHPQSRRRSDQQPVRGLVHIAGRVHGRRAVHR
jgi:hypothetical protein